MKPYFYEFYSGDTLTQVDKEIYRFPNVDDVPCSVFSSRYSTGASATGCSIDVGSLVSGVEADIIKFKAKISTGQSKLRTAGGGWGTAATSHRGWNKYLSTNTGDNAGQGVGGLTDTDYSVDLSYILFKFTSTCLKIHFFRFFLYIRFFITFFFI